MGKRREAGRDDGGEEVYASKDQLLAVTHAQQWMKLKEKI